MKHINTDFLSKTAFDCNNIEALKDFVDQVSGNLGQKIQSSCPVFGSEGNSFFIDITDSTPTSKTIFKTIHLSIKNQDLSLEYQTPSIDHVELYVDIPDYSFIIATIKLFEKACSSNTRICLPLDSYGNVIHGSQHQVFGTQV